MQNACSTPAQAEPWIPVHVWHRAVNDQDTDTAREVASDRIVMGGPRGQAVGVEAFIDWIGQAGIHLRPVSWHPVDSSTVVVEQDATWPGNPQAGADHGAMRVATLFRLDNGRITAALRFDDLHAAVIAASQ